MEKMQVDEEETEGDIMLWEARQDEEGVGKHMSDHTVDEDARKKRSKVATASGLDSLSHAHSRLSDSKVKIALSLYKVQQNIYLLDFQRVEGDAFGFMKLCAFIITELKNLSAASRASSNTVPPPSTPSTHQGRM
jgi:hypothetical protein